MTASSDFPAGACRNPGPQRLQASIKQVAVYRLPALIEAAPLGWLCTQGMTFSFEKLYCKDLEATATTHF